VRSSGARLRPGWRHTVPTWLLPQCGRARCAWWCVRARVWCACGVGCKCSGTPQLSNTTRPPPPPPTHPHTLLPASYVLRACGAAGRWHRPGPLCHAGAEGAHVPQVSACARVWVYLRPPTCCSTCVCE
jgi:hypothetical protein